MGQLNGGGNAYLPDYSVRQLTHLQIIKVPSNLCSFVIQPTPPTVYFTVIYLYITTYYYNAHYVKQKEP